MSTSEPSDVQKDVVTIFEEAEALVHGARREDYGPIKESFNRVSRLWSAYFNSLPIANIPHFLVTTNDVAMMMILFKIAREMNSHKRDNLVDIAGYLLCLEELCKDE